MIYPLLTYPSLPPKKNHSTKKLSQHDWLKILKLTRQYVFEAGNTIFGQVFQGGFCHSTFAILYSILKIHPSFYILKDSHFLFQLSINDVLLRKCRIQHDTIKGSTPCQKVLGHKFKNMGDIKLGFNWSDLRKHSRINRVQQCQKYQICTFILLFAIFCIFPNRTKSSPNERVDKFQKIYEIYFFETYIWWPYF